MTFGFDALPSEKACCFSRVWENRNVSIGAMLYVYGSSPHPKSICPDGQTQTLYQIRNVLIERLDELASGIGGTDILYVSTMLKDILADANVKIREIRSFLGQGIYLGGTVIYVSGRAYAALSFGGSSVYHCSGLTLERLTPVPGDFLIRNALGGSSVWKPDVVLGDLPDGSFGLVAVSCSQINEANCLRYMAETSGGTIAHTPAILIRHEAEPVTGPPSAVLVYLP